MATDFAIIDIGSNSIRYAEEHCGVLSEKEVYTTRLGKGLADTGMLAESTMEASLEVIVRLADRARAKELTPMAYATSAVRDARNGREFAESILKKCGVPVEILSGEQEARFAFDGAVGQEGKYDVLIDIGGASMQIVTRELNVSFRAGCVRCADIVRGVRCKKPGLDLKNNDPCPADCDIDPLAKRSALREYLRGEVTLPEFECGRVVGVGGSITTLAALNLGLDEFDPERVNGSALEKPSLDRLQYKLFVMGDSARKQHPLLKARHDVILYGAYILEYAMEALGADSISVSTADGMEGYLLHLKEH